MVADTGELVAVGNYKANGGIEFDITEFVKDAMTDINGVMESYGTLIKSEDKKCVMSTSDNGEYIPYIKINLKHLPKYFDYHESINEID